MHLRVLHEPKGKVDSIVIEELLPKHGAGDGDLRAPPQLELGTYALADVIAGPLNLVPKKTGYSYPGYPKLVRYFNVVSNMVHTPYSM